GTVKSELSSDDFHTFNPELGRFGAAVDHRLELFFVPELADGEIARCGPAVDRLPRPFGRWNRVIYDLHDLANLASAAGFNHRKIAHAQVIAAGSVEVIDFADFLKANTDNEWLHRLLQDQPITLIGTKLLPC